MAHQLFVPTFNTQQVLAHIEDCLDKGWTGMGYKTIELEEKWNNYTNIPYSLFLNSCTAALHLALETLKQHYGWSIDDEVVVPGITFVSTAHAVLHARLKLRICDVDPQSGNLDLDSLESIVTPRTKCVMFVGLGGNLAGLNKVARFCCARGISLVIDAAHMSGSRIEDGSGSISFGLDTADFVCFSFQAVKNLPTGDAGMLCSSNEHLIEIARRLSWLGIDKDTFSRTNQKGTYKWEYDVNELGYKYNGNSIMASIALAQLPSLDRDNAYRRTLFSWYASALSSTSCNIIRHEHINQTSQHLIQIVTDRRDEVMVALNAQDIYPGVHYKSLKSFGFYSMHDDQTPMADCLSTKLISLPCHMRLTKADVDYISHSLTDILLRTSRD
jgi:dTDP-4-amino-4,6-dideoxygalactose transaminase